MFASSSLDARGNQAAALLNAKLTGLLHVADDAAARRPKSLLECDLDISRLTMWHNEIEQVVSSIPEKVTKTDRCDIAVQWCNRQCMCYRHITPYNIHITTHKNDAIFPVPETPWPHRPSPDKSAQLLVGEHVQNWGGTF